MWRYIKRREPFGGDLELMKFNIAHDARPQARTLLLATLLTLALWWVVPFGDLLTYPFRIFVTFIHEGGHALAALITGNSVASLTVAANGSGEVYSTTGGLFSKMFIASAGYLGAMSFGALLLLLIRRALAARYVLAGSAVLVFALTLIFGVLSPVFSLSFGTLFSLSGFFTIFAGVLLPLGLLAAARYASPRVATFLVGFLAVQCVLNALFDLKTVMLLSTVPGVRTDAMNMAEATGVHQLFWGLMWVVVAFVILSLALRAYSVRRGDASQPDLPFEDSPLEV